MSKSLTARAGNKCRKPSENITGLPQGELLLGFKIPLAIAWDQDQVQVGTSLYVTVSV